MNIYQLIQYLAVAFAIQLSQAVPLWKHSVLKRSTSTVVEFEMKHEFESQHHHEEQQKAEQIMNNAWYYHDCQEPITAADAAVNMRSTCPWYYGYDSDFQRYPINIPKAMLKCGTRCLPENGGVDSGLYECVPINQNVEVLVQFNKTENGDAVYRKSEFIVPVGYTCAGRKFATSGEGVVNTTPGTPVTTTEDFFN